MPHEQLLFDPHRHRRAKTPEAARSERVIRLEKPLELRKRLVVESNKVDLVWVDLRLLKTGQDSVAGKICAPSFVKIDVEGAEWLVLRGMKDILAATRPRIMIEVTNEPEGVFETLAGAGYLLFDERQRAVPHARELARMGPNLFAIPAEDSEAIRVMNCYE